MKSTFTRLVINQNINLFIGNTDLTATLIEYNKLLKLINIDPYTQPLNTLVIRIVEYQKIKSLSSAFESLNVGYNTWVLSIIHRSCQ